MRRLVLSVLIGAAIGAKISYEVSRPQPAAFARGVPQDADAVPYAMTITDAALRMNRRLEQLGDTQFTLKKEEAAQVEEYLGLSISEWHEFTDEVDGILKPILDESGLPK